jgi:hypothetical protein
MSMFQNLNTIICTNLEEFHWQMFMVLEPTPLYGIVRIPDGVKHIPAGAFKHWKEGSRIREVIFPASLETIGEEAFRCCDKLVALTFLGNNLTSIGRKAFLSCVRLEDMTIPDGVTSIGNAAFRSCFFLSHIDIPSSLTSIGGSVFEECIRLETVTFLGNNVTSIGNDAFADCSCLCATSIPNSVTSIGDSAFENCTRLRVPTLGDLVTVGFNAFYRCMRPDFFAASSKPPLKMQHDRICSICHESDWNNNNLNPDNNAVQLNCGHIYHKTCAQTWFTIKENCSMCRAPTTSCNHIIVVKPTPKRERSTTTSSNKRQRR